MGNKLSVHLIKLLSKDLKLNIEKHIKNDIQAIANGLAKENRKALETDKKMITNAILTEIQFIPKKQITKELLTLIVYKTLEVTL